MLYDLCRPVARVKRPDCSYHTGLNDATFMSIFIRRSLQGVMIYTTSPPYSRTRLTATSYASYYMCISVKKIPSHWWLVFFKKMVAAASFPTISAAKIW